MQDQELGNVASEIRILISILAKRARHDMQQHLEAHHAPIGSVHYGILNILQHSQHTISEISKFMMLEPASLVPVVDDLERAGYVRRGHDPQDRRRNPLELTPEGTALVTSIPTAMCGGVFYDALSKMSEARVLELRSLLREFVGCVTGDDNLPLRLAERLRQEPAPPLTRSEE
jgi:DNA-binding MarR family transcriptional regulator